MKYTKESPGLYKRVFKNGNVSKSLYKRHVINKKVTYIRLRSKIRTPERRRSSKTTSNGGGLFGSNKNYKCQPYIAEIEKKIKDSPIYDVSGYTLVKKFTSGKGGGYVYLVSGNSHSGRSSYSDDLYILKVFPGKNYNEDLKEIAITAFLSQNYNQDKFFPRLVLYGKVINKDPITTPVIDSRKKYYFMMTEYVSGISPLDELSTSIDRTEMSEILFQTLYALDTLIKNCTAFNHNDLHPGNILVYRLSSPVTYTISRSDGSDISYRCNTYGIQIIDFGLSSFTGKDRPKHSPVTTVLLKFLKSYGFGTFRTLKSTLKQMRRTSDMRFISLMMLAVFGENETTKGCGTIPKCLRSASTEIFDDLRV